MKNKTKHDDNNEELKYAGSRRASLEKLADALIKRLLEIDGVTEGDVISKAKKLPYRRLNCDRAVFAYVKVRPRFRGVRIDVKPRWKVGRSRLQIESTTATSLLVQARSTSTTRSPCSPRRSATREKA